MILRAHQINYWMLCSVLVPPAGPTLLLQSNVRKRSWNKAGAQKGTGRIFFQSFLLDNRPSTQIPGHHLPVRWRMSNWRQRHARSVPYGCPTWVGLVIRPLRIVQADVHSRGTPEKRSRSILYHSVRRVLRFPYVAWLKLRGMRRTMHQGIHLRPPLRPSFHRTPKRLTRCVRVF